MESMVLMDETDDARTIADGVGTAGQDEATELLSWMFTESGAVTANPLTDSRFIL